MTSIIVFTTPVYGAGETRSNADCGIRNIDYRLKSHPSSFPSSRRGEGGGEGKVKDGRKREEVRREIKDHRQHR
jgi:hypothetical protein